jgi:hypothetical protein
VFVIAQCCGEVQSIVGDIASSLESESDRKEKWANFHIIDMEEDNDLEELKEI